MANNKVTLTKYENQKTGVVFYGYRFKDAMKKEIDGEQYMEVTSSVVKPKMHWVRVDNLKEVGKITFDVP